MKQFNNMKLQTNFVDVNDDTPLTPHTHDTDYDTIETSEFSCTAPGTDMELLNIPTPQTKPRARTRSNNKTTPYKATPRLPSRSIYDAIPYPKDHRIDYEIFHWIFILLFTLIAVIDRFTLNVWPLWVDSPGPTVPGNFSVSVFSLIAWVSSRMMLVSSSYVFLFQNKVFWNWVSESKLVNQYLKISNIHQSNATLHYHVGWAFVGIPVVLHVWTIVFAAAFPQNSIKLYPTWMRPNSPDGNSIPFYANNLLSLGVNDVYRIVSTSLTFFVLIPYSVIKVCSNRNWSVAQWIHLLGASIYTVDLLRMKSHPHCWVFNAPFLLWWMMDRIYGILCYRRCVAKCVHKVDLDDRYSILYLRIPNHIYSMRTIGDVFYFNFLDPHWDGAHPFTIFWNHKARNKMISTDEQLATNWGGHKFNIYNTNTNRENSQYAMSRQSTATCGAPTATTVMDEDWKDVEHERLIMNHEYNWDLAIIMQVFPNHERCLDHRKTWTSELFHSDIRGFAGLRAWGPYRSEFRVLKKEENQTKYPSTPLVLIGTGAGCSFLIDFYQYISSHHLSLEKPVYVYFSTRSIAMFQWFTDITCRKHIDNLFVNAHLTSHDNISYHQKKSSIQGKKSRDSQIGRFSIQEILRMVAPNTHVFYCGSPNVQNMVNALCKSYALTFHAGHSFY